MTKPMLRPRSPLVFILLAVLFLSLAACEPSGSYIVLVTATPFDPGIQTGGGGDSGVNQATVIPPASTTIPTVAPTPTFIPTPNPTRSAIIDPTQEQLHIVQPGDTLSLIASWYGVTVDDIVAANGLPNENILSIGQTLVIPQTVKLTGPTFKIIPDSELVYGPGLQGFSVEAFLDARNSYLAVYTEDLDGRLWSGAEIVERVALEQSLNPRLLLALLEYESQWISQPMISEEAARYPMNYREQPTRIYGLYRQLDWAGKLLQSGYYGWRLRGLAATLLADGTRVGLDPTLNAGTAGVQFLLAYTRSLDQWLTASGHTGLFATYVSLFGDPFQYAVEPLIPHDLTQPEMGFPWAEDETWYYTGGPHGGWGSGSAWAALDFVPVNEVVECEVTAEYARAVADGVIARSEWGIVILDLDGDGFEGTGWTVFYLHISSEDRPVVAGQTIKQGDPIGHPSCEGGISWASHLHIGRRYNGEWIAADCTECLLNGLPAPNLNFDGWTCYSFGIEYNGSFVKGDEYREACTCREPFNTFAPPEE